MSALSQRRHLRRQPRPLVRERESGSKKMQYVSDEATRVHYASARLQKLGKEALLKGDKAMDDPFIVVGGAKSNQIHSMEE